MSGSTDVSVKGVDVCVVGDVVVWCSSVEGCGFCCSLEVDVLVALLVGAEVSCLMSVWLVCG